MTDMIEKVANVLFSNDLGGPNRSMQWSREDLVNRGYLRKARAAIEAHTAHLKEHGMVIVELSSLDSRTRFDCGIDDDGNQLRTPSR